MVERNPIRSGWPEQDRDVATSRDIHHELSCAKYQQEGDFGCRDHRRYGFAVMWVAIFIVLLLLIVGLTLDTAKVLLEAHRLQNGADAAALAGAVLAKNDQTEAQLQAITIASQNFADGQPIELTFNGENWPDGDIVIGLYDRKNQIFIPVEPGTGAVNALKVVARRTEDAHDPIPLLFGPIVGVQTSNVTRYAIAMAVGGDGPGLIALRHDETGLWVHGDIFLNVISTTGNFNDGTIQIDSNDSDGLRISGSSVTVEAALVNVVGEDYRVSGHFECEPPPKCLVAPLGDPLHWLDEPPGYPDWTGLEDKGTIDVNSGTHTLDPGYYSGGFRIGGDSSVTLNAGIYILDGEGLTIVGQADFYANPPEGVMFFFTGSGSVDIRGTGQFHSTAPQSGYYEGVLFFQDRANETEAYIRGTGDLFGLDGTLYFPKNYIKLEGTGGTIGAQLIAWEIEIAGKGVFDINYDGRNKTPSSRSFLVE